MSGEPASASGKNGPGYAQALDELDQILRELEGSDVDVDRLAERVARASELIAVCRQRISAARLRIDEVIAELDGGDAPDQAR
jgi:exodeoxyribonuclease VII small subunit